MRAVINDTLTLNSFDTGCFITGQIKGLELPGSRDSEGAYAGMDGGFIEAQNWDMRLVSFSGVVLATTAAELAQRRRAVIAALATRDIKLDVYMDDGRSYVLYGKLPNNGLDMPRLGTDPYKCPLRIDIKCPDPIIYETTEGSFLSATFYRLAGGGYMTPIITPRISAAGTLPTTITNNGSVDIYPVVKLRGVMTNPVVTNHTLGRAVSLQGFATSSPTDELVINMGPTQTVDGLHVIGQTALLNGDSVMDFVAQPRLWWPLAVGDNSISLQTSGSTDNVTAEITWRSGTMGI